MNFWELITGSDMTKAAKIQNAKIAALPKDYQQAWAKMQQPLYSGAVVTNFSGRNLMPVLESLVAYMQESAADGLSAEDAIGDPAAFATDAAEAVGLPTMLSHWGDKLNAKIYRQLGRTK